MQPHSKIGPACALILASTLSACLSGLGPTGAPLTIHYYSAATVPRSTKTPSGASPLRMRRVTSASLLGKRIVWRTSNVEYGFYEANRWTELPRDWLEEALARELFETRGLYRGGPTDAPSLAIHLAAFEEIRSPKHEARVAVVLRMFGPHGNGLVERSIETREPIQQDDMQAVAAAMSRALEIAVQEVAEIALATDLEAN